MAGQARRPHRGVVDALRLGGAVPAVPACNLEPLREEFLAQRPEHHDGHPWGCHNPRIPDELIFDRLILVLVSGMGYQRVADEACSATTLRRRRDEWIACGVGEGLRLAALTAYDRSGPAKRFSNPLPNRDQLLARLSSPNSRPHCLL